MGCTGRNPVVPRAAAAARAWVVQQQRPVLRSSSGGGRSGVSGEGSGHYASTEHGWPAFSLICCLSLGSPPTGSWHTQSTHWINVRKGAGGSLPPPACRVPPEAVGTQLPIDSLIDGPSNDVNVLPAPRRVRVASSCKAQLPRWQPQPPGCSSQAADSQFTLPQSSITLNGPLQAVERRP